MVTWIEVADSAIKISLGAILGGLFGYVNAKLGFEKDAVKEYSKSRREILKDVVKQCDDFSCFHADYWATLYDALDKKTKNERISDRDLDQLRERGQAFRDAFKDFAHIESNFLLVGEKGLYDEFRSYATATDQFYADAYLENPKLTSDMMNQCRTQFKEKRCQLLLKVGEAFKRAA